MKTTSKAGNKGSAKVPKTNPRTHNDSGQSNMPNEKTGWTKANPAGERDREGGSDRK